MVNLCAQFALLNTKFCSAIDNNYCITKFTSDKEEVKDLLQGTSHLETQLFRSDAKKNMPKPVNYYKDSVNSVAQLEHYVCLCESQRYAHFSSTCCRDPYIHPWPLCFFPPQDGVTLGDSM